DLDELAVGDHQAGVAHPRIADAVEQPAAANHRQLDRLGCRRSDGRALPAGCEWPRGGRRRAQRPEHPAAQPELRSVAIHIRHLARRRHRRGRYRFGNLAITVKFGSTTFAMRATPTCENTWTASHRSKPY